MKAEEYEFCIDAYSPESIPLARLAEYLAQLAALMGNPDRVHFRKLKPGSTRVVTLVEHEAVTRVRGRLQNAIDPAAPDDIHKPVKRINKMLHEDNATGKLTRGEDNVVRFAGREAFRHPRMGPFTEQATIDGKIVRVGGEDQTAHVRIKDSTGRVWSADVSHDLAIQLARLLFVVPVRLAGSARWERNEAGEWELLSFRAKEFSVLKDEVLATAIGRLKSIDADWRREHDPLALLIDLREGNGEAH
jgi:hypothetical protein